MNTATAQADREPPVHYPAAPIQSQGTRAGRRFGRSAWVLHGLAYVFFLSAWGVMLLLGETTEEAQPVQGVGVAAAIVLSLWSFVLSIRALIAAERPLLPVLNIALVMLEITVPCIAAWWPLLLNYGTNSAVFKIALAWGLPVFVPFLSMCGGSAALFAWWWTAKAERRDARRGQETWTRRRRWRYGVPRFAAVLGLLAFLGLPWLLYVYAALSAGDMNNGPLHRAVFHVTPSFVKTGVFQLLEHAPKGSQLKYRFLTNGDMPDDFLHERVNDKSDPLSEAAFLSIWKRETEDGLSLSRRVCKSPQEYSAQVQYLAGRLIAMHGSPEEIGAQWSGPGVVMDPFHDGIYHGLQGYGNANMLPVLLPLLDRDDLIVRRFAARTLAYLTKTKLTATPRPSSIPEAPGELDELETVRAAAKKAMQP